MTWGRFLEMGGYGLYVWGSFGMCALVLILEILLLSARRRALARDPHTPAADARESGA